MKTKRKIGVVLLGFCLSIVCFLGICSGGIISDDTSWSFKNLPKTTGQASDYLWQNLTIKATTEKPVDFDGTCLQLKGAGSVGSRSIAFTVTSRCKITVSCKSTSSDTRTLNVADKNGTVLGTISAPASYTSGSFTYNGCGEELYLYSQSKGISVQTLSISYTDTVLKGDVNGDTAIDDKDALLVLQHLSAMESIKESRALAAANLDNNGVIDMLDVIWILSNKKQAETTTSESTTETTTVNTADGVEVKNFTELKSALDSGRKVYVINDIECSEQINFKTTGNFVIGVPDEKGTLPVLNFDNMVGKNDIVNGKSSDSDAGIRIQSNDNVVKNLVIEHAHDNGILIKGTEVTGNTIENCILRYNNDSGLQITGGSYNNIVRNIYSYRNCDVYTRGGNADGFAIKLSAGPELASSASEFRNSKNTFENCFAWDNGDDAWDSFDYPAEQQNFNPTRWTYKNDYTNCMCWENGLAATHVGYTDYAAGLPLDEELPVIRRIKALVSTEIYNSFVTSYNNGTLCSRTASASTYYSAVDNLTKVSIPTDSGNQTVAGYVSVWGGNPNGFKLGSKYTQGISERTLVRCIAFDHAASGFDKNNAQCNIEIEDCISFKNKINYNLSGMKTTRFTNAYGWTGTSSDGMPTGSGVTPKVTKPASGTGAVERLVRAAAETVKEKAANNIFDATNIFNTAF